MTTKIIFIVICFLFIVWLFFWLSGKKRFDVEFGVSFNQNHAMYLGLDWKETYIAILDDLNTPTIRIAAMWSDVEKVKDTFNFEQVDWMMDEAAKRGVRVVLVVGQKAPRWPECHVPEWVKGEDSDEARERLLRYMTNTVERYRAHPALEIWQVENEPFIPFRFGVCDKVSQEMIQEEIALVRERDGFHSVMITDSGEFGFWGKAARNGDILGSTLYRVVEIIGGVKWPYDWVPAGFYRIKARLADKSYRDFFIAELQAEPWLRSNNPLETPLEEQERMMDTDRLRRTLDFVHYVGASRAYLWGAEWWYWMKQEQHDPRYWDIAKETIKR